MGNKTLNIKITSNENVYYHNLKGYFIGALSLPLLSLKAEKGKVSSGVTEVKPQKDTIHVVGHAHMDMNWLWTHSETMQICNDNLRQTVAFMKEFPDFTMLQSQAAVYNFVEKVDPRFLNR